MLLAGQAFAVRRAEQADAAAIHLLLAENKLPTKDLSDGLLTHFLVATDEKGLAGVIGAEVYGEHALLRSLCTRSDLRQRGIGSALLKGLLQELISKGVRRIFLLTENAEGFFARHGFSRTERKSVPAEIAATEQFRLLCPASAVCMAGVIP